MSLAAVYSQCEAFAQSHTHRHLLWLSGEKKWCYQQLQSLKHNLLAKNSLAILSKSATNSDFNASQHRAICQQQIFPNQCHKQLGQEYQSIVFDGYSGFNPDHLAQVSGTLIAGGVLVLVTPELEKWHLWDDVELDNLWTQPYAKQNVTRNFLTWLQQSLLDDKNLTQFTENQAVIYQTANDLLLDKQQSKDKKPVQIINHLGIIEQQKLVDRCSEYLLANTSAHIVLTAPRGRGKSAALGLLVKRLKHCENIKHFYLTSSDTQAVKQVQNYCGFDFAYITPDQLLKKGAVSKAKELLIIDEAASISVDVLIDLIKIFSQIVFCTTTQGYEGTGQGFSLRFLAYLNAHQYQYQGFNLKLPIRWADNDPVEVWLNKLMLSNALVDSFEQTESTVALENDFSISKINPRELIAKPIQLQQLYTLLAQAHYRTSPSDLRIFLDSPNMHLWIATQGQKVAGVCLVAEEGVVESFTKDSQGMDGEALALAIYRGQRRPRGNLIPQILIGQEGLLAAKGIKVARVVRIATHSNYRRHGVAAQLINNIQSWAEIENYDFLSANFSLHNDVLAFWQQQNFSLIRYGNQLDKITASYSALVLKPLSKKYDFLYQSLLCSFVFRLSFQKKRIFRPEALLHKNQSNGPIYSSHQDYLVKHPEYLSWCYQQLDCFANYHRPFESVGYILLLILEKFPKCWDESVLSVPSRELLQLYFIELAPLADIYDSNQLCGYKSLVKKMRTIVQEILLASYYSPQGPF